MGAMAGFIWFVALIMGGMALLVALALIARNKYIASGQEEGE
jgi:hypothetical protein